MSDRRVAIVGGGITGLTAALTLATAHGAEVVVIEADPCLGGKIRSTPFAGVDGVDEGADAFLARVAHATDLARQVGLGDDLTSPTGATAAVWHHGMHPLPDGLVLGAPSSMLTVARSGLLSWRGKARAALEPLLPPTSTTPDSIGAHVRARFGVEVHERIVDALVGSIYAADTDRFSLAMVPQLAALAEQRSMLIGARRARRGAGAAPAGPLFFAPQRGMASLIEATAAAITSAGGTIRCGVAATAIEATDPGDGRGRWLVDGEAFSGVVVATPAAQAATLLKAAAPDAAAGLAAAETAEVAIVTIAVDAAAWPERMHDRSGYLVAKPAQRTVTAVSFGSQKWAHWRPADGSQILRISLGRDGLTVLHLDDDELVQRAVDETSAHLGIDLRPAAIRVTRWPHAFPQYRPHHLQRVAAIESALPEGIVVAGAAHRGIGIAACVEQGRRAAATLGARHQVMGE